MEKINLLLLFDDLATLSLEDIPESCVKIARKFHFYAFAVIMADGSVAGSFGEFTHEPKFGNRKEILELEDRQLLLIPISGHGTTLGCLAAEAPIEDYHVERVLRIIASLLFVSLGNELSQAPAEVWPQACVYLRAALERLANHMPVSFTEITRQVEAALLSTALKTVDGYQNRATTILGLKPAALKSRLSKYGLKYKTFRRKSRITCQRAHQRRGHP